ncbi:MAG: DMT family transporter [Gallionella sp.]|nr:DMT family transporter [Gallionella sp.]
MAISDVALPRGSLAITSVLVGAFFWGLLWLPLKALDVMGVSGSIVQVYSYGLAALLLLPFALRSFKQWRDQLGLLAIITLMGGWANAALVTSLTEGSVVRVMLLFFLAPVWTILAARIFLGEAFTRLRFISLLLALAGLAATLGGPKLFAAPLTVIDLLALSSGLAFALSNVAVRVGHHLTDSVRATAMIGGCALIALVFLVFDNRPLQTLHLQQLSGMLALGLLWILPGTLISFYGVARLDAGRAAILLLGELVVAVCSAVWLGGEVLTIKEAVGGSLILAAAVLETVTETTDLERAT